MPVVRINAEKDARCTQSVVQLQGDTRTTMVRFIVNRYDGGVDLAGLVWLIKTTNAAGVPDAWEPEMVENAGEKIVIDWLIQGSVNDADGLTEYELNGLGYEADGKAIKWVGGKGTVSVRKSYHPTFGDDADGFSNLEKLIIYVNGELQDTVAAVERAEAAATAAAAASADSIWTSKPQGLSFGQQLQAQENIGLLEVVKNLTEPVEAEGNPVRMENLVGGLPFDGVVTVLEPKQAGGGEAAPDNIRSISGWTGTNLVRTGKNLFSGSRNKQISNGLYLEKDRGSEVTVYGTPSVTLGMRVFETQMPAGTYTFSIGEIGNVNRFEPCIDGTPIAQLWSGDTWTLTLEAAADVGLNMIVSKGADCGTEDNPTRIKVQLESGADATGYEPYRGEACSADFGRTVYGGRLDWQKGVLKADRAIVAFNGAEAAWVRHDASGLVYINAFSNPELPVQGQGSPYGVCSHFRRTTANNYFDMEDGEFATGLHQFSSITAYAIFKDAKNGASVDAWKAYLAAQYAAGTPVQVVYKLAAPVEIPLTPQEIKQLEGTNTLYGDGMIRIEGRQERAGGGGIAQETDPTVPEWAKQPNKPAYTAEEVGAASKEEVIRLSEEIAPVTAVKELFEDAIVNHESANIFKPEYVRNSRYDYTTGNVYWSSSTAIRNANPISVYGNTQYSFQEFIGSKLSVSFFFYDASGVIIGQHLQGDLFTHFTTPANAVSLNFHIAAWDTNHPDEEPMVMIWKTDSTDKRTEFIPFSEDGRVESVELPKLQVPKYEKDGESILAMKKAAFDYGFNYIAYSKISGEANSINTAEHFEHCAKLPFDMLKGDVRPTADGGVIMCHDAGFTLDDNGDIIAFNADNCTLISEMTEAECLALNHVATGNYVCNLDKFLSICKRYGKVAYITIRDEHIADVVVPTMMRLLDKYHMRTRCIVNSFTTESLQAVRAMDEYIMLSRVCAYASGTAGITKEFVDSAIGLGNCRVVIFCFSSSSTDATVLDNSAEAIAYAIENDVRVDTAQVADGISISDLLARGITGAQMTVAPDAD